MKVTPISLVRLSVVMLLCLTGCGTKGIDAKTTNTTNTSLADFSGYWSGTFGTTKISYWVVQSSDLLYITKLEPADNGMTYFGVVSGNTAGVCLYGNGTRMGYTTWTKVDDSTVRIFYNSCDSITGFTCDIPDGTTITFKKENQTPASRLIDHGDGTVFDSVNNLYWLKDANCFGRLYWSDASSRVSNLADGLCGLSDGSKAGDWRLPTVSQLSTLVGARQYFMYVVYDFYWTSSTLTDPSTGELRYYLVNMFNGSIQSDYGSDYWYFVWPVRLGK